MTKHARRTTKDNGPRLSITVLNIIKENDVCSVLCSYASVECINLFYISFSNDKILIITCVSFYDYAWKTVLNGKIYLSCISIKQHVTEKQQKDDKKNHDENITTGIRLFFSENKFYFKL